MTISTTFAMFAVATACIGPLPVGAAILTVGAVVYPLPPFETVYPVTLPVIVAVAVAVVPEVGAAMVTVGAEL